MKDFQIRKVLRKTELKGFLTDGVSKVKEEMRIPGAQARIDIAVINGLFHGYEIKSASDTLQRLPNQLVAYSYVFDYLNIVTEEKHVNKIEEITPKWVGIQICERKEIIPYRPAEPNNKRKGFYIAKLLWREELMEVLSDEGIPFKKNLRNWILCEILNESLEITELSARVREKLKKRVVWEDLE